MVRFARVIVLAGLALVALRAPAYAYDVAVGPAPIVSIQLEAGSASVTVWNRPYVEIVSQGVTWRHVAAPSHLPTEMNFWAQQVPSERGPLTLPAELFELPPITGLHDAVVARGFGDTTVLIPQDTALVVVRTVGRGTIDVSGYQGTLVAVARNGVVRARNIGGTAYLQSLRGGIFVTDSTFERVRARTAAAPVIFSNCQAAQIDETSVAGAVIFDNGTLGQGPVHFASEFGNVGIGISGLSPRWQQQGGAVTATLAGGTVVTATSTHGSAFMYQGSLTQHPELLNRWPRLQRFAPSLPFRPPAFVRPPARRRPPLPSSRRPAFRRRQR
jgi:hypothetical protein